MVLERKKNWGGAHKKDLLFVEISVLQYDFCFSVVNQLLFYSFSKQTDESSFLLDSLNIHDLLRSAFWDVSVCLSVLTLSFWDV